MSASDLTEGNGRTSDGRFAAGNKLGRGNLHGKRINELRKWWLDCVTEEDTRAVYAALLKEALNGNIYAVKEWLDRSQGKPLESDVFERLEELEGFIQEATANQ